VVTKIDRFVAVMNLWWFCFSVFAKGLAALLAIFIAHRIAGPRPVTKSPTFLPTTSPSEFPTLIPSVIPTVEPTPTPTTAPTFEPTVHPTDDPSAEPTFEPTALPTEFPTTKPSRVSQCPSTRPTTTPTAPTKHPTGDPSYCPTVAPSQGPSASPTAGPSAHPTVHPTTDPSYCPTVAPSRGPSASPTAGPSAHPTVHPTADPTTGPTIDPTFWPTVYPTPNPTAPTTSPSSAPTRPTRIPTARPSVVPTTAPTNPTAAPSAAPTARPTRIPTVQPTTRKPTTIPTARPTRKPTSVPTWPTWPPSTKIPSDVLNLTRWYLQLPVSETGVDDSPWFITTAELQPYADSYFYAGALGGVVFRTPVSGVHTSGSENPRTELRETNFLGTLVDWAPTYYALSSLSATMQVNQVHNVTVSGLTAQIIIGQIKGTGTGNSTDNPIAMMQYRYYSATQTGRVVVQVATSPTSEDSTTYTFPSALNVRLNQTFTYEMVLTKDTTTGGPSFAITVNTDTIYPPLSVSWSAHQVYFKAGSYLKYSAESTGLGQLTFFALNATHVN
jgi:hypothetical protein